MENGHGTCGNFATMLKLFARTTEGQESIKVPVCWEEVTVAQFQRMALEWDGEDWIKLFSILSGKEYAGIASSKSYKLESSLYAAVRFVFEQPFNFERIPMPQFIVINGKTVQIPKKIGRLSIGQAIQVRKYIESVGDDRAAISRAVAVYLQPLIDGRDFDYERALEIEKAVLSLPIVKIFPVGFFLLKKLNPSGNWLQSVLRRIKLAVSTNRKKSHGLPKFQGLNRSQI